MRENTFLSFSDMRCSLEPYDDCCENDYPIDSYLLREERPLCKLLDTATYELERQFTELGLEPASFSIRDDKLYYGKFRITGDIIQDLSASDVSLYSLEVEANVIYSERAVF